MVEGPKSHVETCILSLIASGALTTDDAERAREETRSSESVFSAARRLGLIPDQDAALAAAATLSLPFLTVEETVALVPPEGRRAPQEAFLQSHRIAIGAGAGGGLIAALADPFDETLRRAVSMASEGPVAFAVASEAGVDAWRTSRSGSPARPSERAAGRGRGDRCPS